MLLAAPLACPISLTKITWQMLSQSLYHLSRSSFYTPISILLMGVMFCKGILETLILVPQLKGFDLILIQLCLHLIRISPCDILCKLIS